MMDDEEEEEVLLTWEAWSFGVVVCALHPAFWIEWRHKGVYTRWSTMIENQYSAPLSTNNNWMKCVMIIITAT